MLHSIVQNPTESCTPYIHSASVFKRNSLKTNSLETNSLEVETKRYYIKLHCGNNLSPLDQIQNKIS